MKDYDIFPSTICAMLTIIQPDEVKAWISLVCTVLTALVTIAYKVYKWYLAAKEDKKLTEEEVKQLYEIITKENNNNE